MSDIVERLNAAQLDRDNCPYMDSEVRVRVGLARDAADEIESLRSRLAEAERRLKNYEPTNLYNGLTIDRWKARCDEAEALLRDTKRDLRIAAKCMNPYAPVHRQFNETADRIDAYLSREQP